MLAYREIDNEAPDYEPLPFYSSEVDDFDGAEWLRNLSSDQVSADEAYSAGLSLVPDADGPDRMAVFVLEGGRARLVPVDLGARNGNAAWIRSGLAAGAKVIVYPPATLSDGARVKERSVTR